jgi:hypothetical protein
MLNNFTKIYTTAQLLYWELYGRVVSETNRLTMKKSNPLFSIKRGLLFFVISMYRTLTEIEKLTTIEKIKL